MILDPRAGWRLVGFALALSVVCGMGRAAEGELRPAAGDHTRLMYWVDEAGRERPVTTAAEWALRRADILRGMQAAMGPLPERTKLPALDSEVREEIEGDGFRRLTVSYTAEPGDRVPADLYLPGDLRAGERRAAVLALHPTSELGKRVIAKEEPKPNRAYAVELAQRGYVVLAPDYPSFGEYAGYDFAADGYSSGTMKGIVNHLRAVDLLSERAEVDRQRIGAIGHSLGGHNAMFAAAFDERIKAVVSSCGWTPFHDYYAGDLRGWTSDRYMPRLRERYALDAARVPFDFYEVVGAIAPRPFFSSSPERDDNFAVAGVRKAAAEAGKVYALLGAGDGLNVHYPDCGHDFPPEIRGAAYRFLDRALGHQPSREVP